MYFNKNLFFKTNYIKSNRRHRPFSTIRKIERTLRKIKIGKTSFDKK